MEHINKAPQTCKFPPWAIKTLHNKFNHKHNSHDGHTNNSTTQQMDNNNSGSNNKNISIVVPYTHGLGKGLKEQTTTWVNNLGIQEHFRGTNPIKTFLMAPKDGDNKLQKSGVIYRFKCPHINCPEEYKGESGRSFGEQLKEHLRAPSSIHQHSHSARYPVSPNCFIIVDRESQGVTRNIKEAMHIQVNDPHSIGTWANTICHTSETKFYRTHHHSSSNRTAHHPSPTYGPPTVTHTTNWGHTQLQCW